ncbi:4-(cytidine 5'-diphospho)-2-C-methyl-D-erythritol kinase [Nonomuraea muscovyensis]|uniref:4-diphosphocytidyl-2-C-methyl-D-erythritol kinase n=1 Tax=Nonomuraea muscovyensis TaxID=1124761 RepID=A0A7X0EUS8_9ACTN|nr:4-(cytidine 5'-diphospho)-2-C-methyl-D-erythritol kinase [Nonomuraea muscovyensis]MBB6345092.1 4-diphosphocytidyl-2-C-methyl-D-erythritol kinase [Nonomuraea muscovyensis]MDF2710738.1 4-(cytidine 5-diphospho)-2-C-methyl-D-erythritol kinase [Nonomuraea muscovyensis]
MSSVTVRVPAKVNVQLSVGPLREDGYHDLVNVFHAVSVFDEVVAKESDSITVSVVGEWADQVPVDDGNLAIQAARALAKHAGRTYGAHLVIHKSIPVAGGMAGGSADAAGALVACNELWGLGLPFEDLMEIAGDLGSDVPFSLLGGTAVGTGRGEQLSELPTTGSFHWAFAVAPGGLSTAEVYAQCDRRRESAGVEVPWPQVDDSLLEALSTGDADTLGARLTNDLQAAALTLRPELARTLEAGRAEGALGAIVSGSGPTCAFLATDADHAQHLADTLAKLPTCRAALAAHGPVPGPRPSWSSSRT